MQLVQVGVLGRAALAHQDDVGPGRDGPAVELFQISAAGPVGSGDVSGHGVDNMFVRIQHHVDDVVHTDQGGGFFDVLPDRIASQGRGMGSRLHHVAVVGADSGPGGNAGHDGLGSAAVAGKSSEIQCCPGRCAGLLRPQCA